MSEAEQGKPDPIIEPPDIGDFKYGLWTGGGYSAGGNSPS